MNRILGSRAGTSPAPTMVTAARAEPYMVGAALAIALAAILFLMLFASKVLYSRPSLSIFSAWVDLSDPLQVSLLQQPLPGLHEAFC